MSWAGKQHPLDAAIEWLAPIPLAIAVSWSGLRLGLESLSSIALGAFAVIAGFIAIRVGGRASAIAMQDFEPALFEPVEPDELILEEQDTILELHDRLEESCPDSRVVRLFERQDPTPGELVDRIVDFLAEGRPRQPTARPVAQPEGLPDASAALHEALANIRASLR